MYIIRLLIIFVVAIACSNSIAIAEVKLLWEGGKCGLVDYSTGEIFIKPKYDRLAIIKRNNDGSMLFTAVINGKYGVIDKNGNVIINLLYSALHGSSGDVYIAKNDYNKMGILDNTGNVLIPFEYANLNFMVINEQISPKSYRDTTLNDLFIAQTDTGKGGKYGVINKSNTFIILPEYDAIISATKENNIVKFKVKKGYKEEIIAASNGDAIDQEVKKVKRGDNIIFITKRGEEIICEDAWEYKNGYARIKQRGKWGFIDNAGRINIPPIYNYVWDYDGEKAKVRLENGAIQYVNMFGNIIEP